jgi:hypothetical protein
MEAAKEPGRRDAVGRPEKPGGWGRYGIGNLLFPAGRPQYEDHTPGVGLSGAMGARAVRVVSGAIWPFAVTLALGGLGLPIFYRGADSAGEFGPALSIFFVLVLLGLVSLGVLVSSRRPGNPVGWIITGSGMSLMVSGFAQSYGIYALYTDPGNMPGDAFMAWISS